MIRCVSVCACVRARTRAWFLLCVCMCVCDCACVLCSVKCEECSARVRVRAFALCLYAVHASLSPSTAPFQNISIRPPPSLSPFLRAATPRPAPRPSPSSAPHRPTRGASPARAAGLLAAADITARSRHHGLQQTSRPATDITACNRHQPIRGTDRSRTSGRPGRRAAAAA